VTCLASRAKCCDTTAREASARGLEVFFVADAVETFDLVDHRGERIDKDEISRITFASIANGFGQVVTVTDLMRTV